MTGLAFKAFIADHLPKIIAAVIVGVLLGSVALWIASREREEARIDNSFVEKGRIEERAEQQGRVIENVEKANDAERNPTLDARERVRAKYDRCTANPDCE